MSAVIATQKALRARLVGTAAVTNLVPADSILDVNERPAPDPSIIMGEGQTVDEGTDLQRRRERVFLDLHVWKKEPSTAGVKAIAGAIGDALRLNRLVLETGFHCVDILVNGARFLRDPDGVTSHAVVTVESLVEITS